MQRNVNLIDILTSDDPSYQNDVAYKLYKKVKPYDADPEATAKAIKSECQTLLSSKKYDYHKIRQGIDRWFMEYKKWESTMGQYEFGGCSAVVDQLEKLIQEPIKELKESTEEKNQPEVKKRDMVSPPLDLVECFMLNSPDLNKTALQVYDQALAALPEEMAGNLKAILKGIGFELTALLKQGDLLNTTIGRYETFIRRIQSWDITKIDSIDQRKKCGILKDALLNHILPVLHCERALELYSQALDSKIESASDSHKAKNIEMIKTLKFSGVPQYAHKQFTKAYASLKENPVKNATELSHLTEGIWMATKAITNPQEVDLGQITTVANKMIGRSSTLKKAGGALLVLGGVLAIGICLASMPFTGGLGLPAAMLIGSSIISYISVGMGAVAMATGSAAIHSGKQKDSSKALAQVGSFFTPKRKAAVATAVEKKQKNTPKN